MAKWIESNFFRKFIGIKIVQMLGRGLKVALLVGCLVMVSGMGMISRADESVQNIIRNENREELSSYLASMAVFDGFGNLELKDIKESFTNYHVKYSEQEISRIFGMTVLKTLSDHNGFVSLLDFMRLQKVSVLLPLNDLTPLVRQIVETENSFEKIEKLLNGLRSLQSNGSLTADQVSYAIKNIVLFQEIDDSDYFSKIYALSDPFLTTEEHHDLILRMIRNHSIAMLTSFQQVSAMEKLNPEWSRVGGSHFPLVCAAVDGMKDLMSSLDAYKRNFVGDYSFDGQYAKSYMQFIEEIVQSGRINSKDMNFDCYPYLGINVGPTETLTLNKMRTDWRERASAKAGSEKTGVFPQSTLSTNTRSQARLNKCQWSTQKDEIFTEIVQSALKQNETVHLMMVPSADGGQCGLVLMSRRALDRVMLMAHVTYQAEMILDAEVWINGGEAQALAGFNQLIGIELFQSQTKSGQ
jgi:hypothetical protein